MGFFQEYFLTPFYTDSGYNIINSLVYALIAVLLLYAIYEGLQRLKININKEFFYALIPFILFGSSLRAFVDHKIVPYNFLTVSPGIWMFVAGLFLLALVLSWRILKEKYCKACAGAGLVLVSGLWLFFFRSLSFGNPWGGILIAGLAGGLSLLLYLIFKIVKCKWCKEIAFFPFAAHMLDASATFIAVDFFGAVEKHPLTRFFSELTGSAASLFFLKLAILLPAVYLVQKEIKEKNLRNFILIAMAVLGLSEGLRDLITLML